jgi:spermidine synthase
MENIKKIKSIKPTSNSHKANHRSQEIIKSNSRLLLAIFLISASVLSFEITVTRISSIIFAFNYVFVIISLAILGLGCGGIFAYYKWRNQQIRILDNIYNTLSFYGSLFALSVSLFIVLTTSVPFFIYSLPFFAISFMPFFFAGFILAIIFRAFPQEIFKIYAFDLFGAATGAILVILALNSFGGVEIVLSISILGLITAFLFLKRNNKKRVSLKKFSTIIVIAIFCILLFLTNSLFGFLGEIPSRNEPQKDLSNILANFDSEIIESRWSAFGRVDLVKYLDDDSQMSLFIDGAAGTPMFKFDGNIDDVYYKNRDIDFLEKNRAGVFPFLFLNDDEKDNMLIIGPGGGWEVLLGLINGVGSITGVEVNKDFVEIVKEYKDYNGGIYTDFANVDILVEEGRNFIRNTQEKFDIIMISIPLTKSSRSVEGYALTENYLLTEESIKDYYNHLTEEGRILVVLHDSVEVMRFITTSLVALEKLGINSNQAMTHIYTVGEEMKPVVVLQKNPFDLDEIDKRHDLMHIFELDTTQTYLPYIEQEIENMEHADGTTMMHYMFNNSLVELSKGEIGLRELINRSAYDISPASDNRPFFFDSKPGLPNNLFLLLIIVLLVNSSVIIAPLTFWKTKKGFSKLILLFLLLGAGFMMIEITFFQKLTFYMGSPTISLAVIITSLLVGMGVGSFLGKKIYKTQNIKRLVLFSFLIFIIAIGLFFIIPFIMNNFNEAGILIKSLVVSILLIPLGFILGIPFPTGINLVKEMGLENSIPWLYGINGTMSVLGSIVAIIISTTIGFSTSLIIGALLYLTIALIFAFGKKTN